MKRSDSPGEQGCWQGGPNITSQAQKPLMARMVSLFVESLSILRTPLAEVWRVYCNGASMEEGAELGGAQSPREKSQCVGGWREENCISGSPRQGWRMEEERVQWGRHLPWTANPGSIPSLYSVLQMLSVTRAHRVWPRPLLPLPKRYSKGRTGNMGGTKAEAGTLCF